MGGAQALPHACSTIRATALALAAFPLQTTQAQTGWPAYGHAPEARRFSPWFRSARTMPAGCAGVDFTAARATADCDGDHCAPREINMTFSVWKMI